LQLIIDKNTVYIFRHEKSIFIFPPICREAFMTDPVSKISRSQETDRKAAHGGMIRNEKRKFHPDEPSDDSVDISEEARERASGKKRKTILEYLEDDEG
jgi:hypothetical protein